MAQPHFGLWRPCFILSALLIMIGGPMHPRGTMADMLGHHNWVPSHLLQLAGFIALLAGLILYGRAFVLPDRTRKWLRLAAVGTALQAVEMAFHTAAAVDHANLVAGSSTPVLTAHLWLSVVFYPLFGATIIGLILAAARDRAMGSPWISWLGILGALAHGAAAPLVIVFEVPYARLLFPCVLLLALWLLLAGLWPVRLTAPRSSAGDGFPADAPEPAAG